MKTVKFVQIALMLLYMPIYSQGNWTWRNPLPQGNTLYSVTYGNGPFVAIGQAGTIISSIDGIS